MTSAEVDGPSRRAGGAGRLRISVVVPALDEEALLPACLASLAAQDRPADEVLVVDNGSRDATAALARAAGATVLVEPRRGIWPAAARGYDAASGDVIARCDADSTLPPGWLAAVEAAFADPACLAVTGPGRFRGLGPVAARLADVLYMRAYFGLLGVTLGGTPLFGSSLALRSATWRDVRDEVHREVDLHDDLDLSFHLPTGSVRYEPAMTVGISARPLRSGRGLVRRVVRGFRSVLVHWPEQGPWMRHRRPAPVLTPELVDAAPDAPVAGVPSQPTVP
ncbi:glycosyltransferase family 2 protein [Cellulomonas marina]|uniref:4,4'-diaponeurosporenoate glycosyltransferase n=1 Tax=Cellulomonas marina TaxID=988821 RepID=A0A1I0YE70_9CELL|nr:glycosyltransferase family 2 protein [Cellulomonas marina]GIG28737.1 glycosyl hydrolase [Cellulomonas marina]SFB11679.1 Glycosyl transferase family 2 [Cellulomonas marina]